MDYYSHNQHLVLLKYPYHNGFNRSSARKKFGRVPEVARFETTKRHRSGLRSSPKQKRPSVQGNCRLYGYRASIRHLPGIYKTCCCQES